VCGGGFIMTGPDEETVAKNREWVRYRLAFYGSTPAYLPVMALHGWEDLAQKLLHMSKTGQWQKMAAEVPDDMLDEFGVYAAYDRLPEAIEERFGGISDTVEIQIEEETDLDVAQDLLARVRQIESRFEAHANRYA
jgi:hypothetical protein